MICLFEKFPMKNKDTKCYCCMAHFFKCSLLNKENPTTKIYNGNFIEEITIFRRFEEKNLHKMLAESDSK